MTSLTIECIISVLNIKGEIKLKHYTYIPEGVCSVQIDYDIEDGKIYNLKYIKGCNGNLKAIGALVEGMPIEEVIKKLRGIECGFKGTSCSDQLARSLEKVIAEEQL